MQNFRSSTAHVKFQQICTLTGFFCWKYMKFLLKWYRGITSHDTEEWCKIRRKTDLFFLKKWQEFCEFWSENSKVSKVCTLLVPFLAKYVTFDLKKYRGVYFMTLKSHSKFEEKLTCGFENGMRNLANFHQNAFESLKIMTLMGSFYPK